MTATIETGPVIHELKTWPEEWFAIDQGKKTADIRLDDRNYRPGDVLLLQCWDPDGRTVDQDTQVETLGAYSGAQCWRKVTHVMTGDRFGLAPGYVLLSFSWRRLHPCTPGTEHRWPPHC